MRSDDAEDYAKRYRLEQAVIDAARAVKESDEHGAVAWDDVIQDLIDAVRALDGAS